MEKTNLGEFENVGASKRAQLRIRDVGDRSYHAILLVLGGTTFDKSHLSSITVKQGGRTLIEDISGTQLQAINSLYGLADTTDILFIYFGDPKAMSVKGEHMGDLDTSIYNVPIDILIDIAAGVTADATLEGHALIGPPKAAYNVFSVAEAAMVRAIRRNQTDPANAVTKQAVDLLAASMSAGGAVRGLHLFHANLSEFTVKKNGIPIFDEVNDTLNDAIQADYGRSPQAGMFSWLPILDGNQGEAVVTARADGTLHNLQTSISTSAADTITGFEDFFAKVPAL